MGVDNVVKVNCKLEYVDSPLKVLTDSGGRMIPEELDKALDNVKAGGRVSYHVSHREG